MQVSMVLLARSQGGDTPLASSTSKYSGWKHPQSCLTESKTQNLLHCCKKVQYFQETFLETSLLLKYMANY